MGEVLRVVCVRCGEAVEAPVSAGTCPRCDDPFAVLDVEYDLDRVRGSLTRDALSGRPENHWRYRELLPVESDAGVFGDGGSGDGREWRVGWTPLMDSPRLAAWAGAGRLRVKDDGRSLTGSLKDRASSVGVLHALQRGADRIACASTGNAASSLAGWAAVAGLDATIFVPRRAPAPKVTQLLMYGADVRRVRGTYAQAYDLCSAECDRGGWYNRNCAINPYLVEGKKTCGLEIAEQTAGSPADWVVVSVGDGCTVAGIAKGLMEMRAIGLADRSPRVLGVQAAGVDPIARAFEQGALVEDEFPGTIADSIDVPVPRNWRKAVARVRASGGGFVHVSDEEIEAAMRAGGRLAGVFAEPAAAAAIAGVRRAVLDGVIASGEDVVVVSSGSGLKDIETASRVAGEPRDVDPM
jgi:threonine synthase